MAEQKLRFKAKIRGQRGGSGGGDYAAGGCARDFWDAGEGAGARND